LHEVPSFWFTFKIGHRERAALFIARRRLMARKRTRRVWTKEDNRTLKTLARGKAKTSAMPFNYYRATIAAGASPRERQAVVEPR
jgi:hypothetical protein